MEVANDAAHLVNPFEVSHIRNGIVTLIGDREYRTQLLERGRKNKERFNADRIANSYYELYKKVADESSTN